jgi:hypothetical protein
MPNYNYDEGSFYHYPNGNLAFLCDLDTTNQPPGTLTAGTNCIGLGHIEENGVSYEEDSSDLKTFKNNLSREVGAKVQNTSGVWVLKLLQKNKELMTYLKAKTGVTKMLLGVYMGIINSEHHWIFSIVRNGSKIKQGSSDEATELNLRAVAVGSAVTWDTSDMSAIETALSIAIHPTTATLAADTYSIDSYTAVS